MTTSLLRRLGSWLSGGSKQPRAPQASTHFIYVKIPESLMPLDRGAKYEDPIDDVLKERDLGEVSGGGSQLGDQRPDGTRPIEFCGIDIDARELAETRSRLRAMLVDLGAPSGTEIHFTIGERKLQDLLSPDGWLLEQPRISLHPGFGT